MKNTTVIKDNKWVWPAADENSWEGQNKQKDLVSHILPHLKGNNIMVQAGGNCGFILSTFVPHFNHVYTFEPDPTNFYCLNQNVTSPSVTKLQMCLSEYSDSLQIQQLVRENKSHDIGGVHVAGNGFTPAIAIDSLNLSGCDLIQLDVEGYELKALKGAVKTIQKYKPIICVEFCESWLNRYDSNSTMLFNFLKELNYVLVDEYGSDKIFMSNEL